MHTKNQINKAFHSFSKFKDGKFREYQAETIETIVNSKLSVFVLNGPTGCHPAEQGILMYNGETKEIEDIKENDLLMGMHSEPLKVLNLVRGYGKIYKIVPTKGSVFFVNEDHILTLVRTPSGECYSKTRRKRVKTPLLDNTVLDISVKDYFLLSKTQKHYYKLFRTKVDFEESNFLPINPYFLGLLLGDGSLRHQVQITTIDDEIVEFIKSQIKVYDFDIRIQNKVGTKAKDYFLRNKYYKRANNYSKSNSFELINSLKKMGLYPINSGNKFIPFDYKIASLQDRLNMIAGLLDTDGSYSACCYDFISKSEKLAGDLTFMCRSVGLAAYMKPSMKVCANNGKRGIYYRVSISGDCSIIPCKVKRKIAHTRRQKKNVLRTGFEITFDREDNYYGFNLSGNGRYVLDDFTVTHNSGKSIIGTTIVKLFGDGIYLCHSKFLQDQIKGEFPEFKLLFGRSNYKCLEASDSSLTCADCLYQEPKLSCKNYGKCLYRVQKLKVAIHPLRCLNYTYFLHVNNYTSDKLFANKPVIICDEVDKLESELLNFINIVVTEAQIRKLKLSLPKYKTACTKGILDWKTWAFDSLERVRENLDNLPWYATRKEREYLESFWFKLKNFINMVDETWLLEYKEETKYGQRWSFMPTWLTPEMTDKFFRNHCGKLVLMSAKLPSPEALSKKLGIPVDEMDFLEVPSAWDKKNRPIKFIPTVAINVTTTDEELESMKPVIEKILEKHRNDKGLVHTSSYKLTNFVMNIDNDRLITHNSDNKVETIEYFKKSDRPLVIVSPSMNRGVSLDDNWCRFIIFFKSPFLNLGDKQTSVRMHSSEEGRLWYDSECIQNIEQGCGRGVRHKDDWCHIYLLDKNIEKLYDKRFKLFSRHFKESIIW